MPRDYQLETKPTDKPEPEGYDAVTIHLAILEALADGVDPMSGEPLPGESVFKSDGVLAALAAGTVALQKEQARLERQTELPNKAGKPWDAEEDKRLVDAFDAGTPVKELAERHGRTPGAINSRLAKLGKLVP